MKSREKLEVVKSSDHTTIKWGWLGEKRYGCNLKATNYHIVSKISNS